MKIRFRADNDLDRSIVRGLLRRQPAIDFRDTPSEGLDDVSVLRWAAQEGRILVSHDLSTMPAAFHEFRQSECSPGVLLVPQGSPLWQPIQHLSLVWELSESSEWANRICYLPTLADWVG